MLDKKAKSKREEIKSGLCVINFRSFSFLLHVLVTAADQKCVPAFLGVCGVTDLMICGTGSVYLKP